MHKIFYEALMRLLINAFESSVSEDQKVILDSKTAAVEELKLNLGLEKALLFLKAMTFKCGMKCSHILLNP